MAEANRPSDHQLARCEYCGFCLVVAGPRECCQAGKDVDRLRGQLEVAEAGYHAAVVKAGYQARTNRELNDLQAEVNRFRAAQCAQLNKVVEEHLGSPDHE